MLFFSKRKKLAEKYKEWIKSYNDKDFQPLDCPQTVIDWLTIEGLLDFKKVEEFLRVNNNISEERI